MSENLVPSLQKPTPDDGLVDHIKYGALCEDCPGARTVQCCIVMEQDDERFN